MRIEVSQGARYQWWREGMAGGYRNVYECVAVYSATDGDLPAHVRGRLASYDEITTNPANGA